MEPSIGENVQPLLQQQNESTLMICLFFVILFMVIVFVIIKRIFCSARKHYPSTATNQENSRGPLANEQDYTMFYSKKHSSDFV
ncbi:unnamed protein product [Rotaria socialis]|uniref:Uncharacterized protein n=1 Tax=Rotaria socialis TaxID=392032 RepID=A0A817REU2_9BILA|nr:unnamed protein product [Rotaria socialis]CAF3241193.1 unnamed protein product [Rotaria socialis]CAF4895175.1 unnamed protein product [Rotaria socialis]